MKRSERKGFAGIVLAMAVCALLFAGTLALADAPAEVSAEGECYWTGMTAHWPKATSFDDRYDYDVVTVTAVDGERTATTHKNVAPGYGYIGFDEFFREFGEGTYSFTVQQRINNVWGEVMQAEAVTYYKLTANYEMQNTAGEVDNTLKGGEVSLTVYKDGKYLETMYPKVDKPEVYLPAGVSVSAYLKPAHGFRIAGSTLSGADGSTTYKSERFTFDFNETAQLTTTFRELSEITISLEFGEAHQTLAAATYERWMGEKAEADEAGKSYMFDAMQLNGSRVSVTLPELTYGNANDTISKAIYNQYSMPSSILNDQDEIYMGRLGFKPLSGYSDGNEWSSEFNDNQSEYLSDGQVFYLHWGKSVGKVELTKTKGIPVCGDKVGMGIAHFDDIGINAEAHSSVIRIPIGPGEIWFH